MCAVFQIWWILFSLHLLLDLRITDLENEERMELAGEGRMLVREWLWKKSLLLQLSGEVFIGICSDQLLGAGERGGMFWY